MTNTLHRFGPKEDFEDDYILFAMCTRGKNDQGAPEKLRRFLEICARHDPVNMGDGKDGGIHRPSRNLNPTVHWRRDDDASYRKVIDGVHAPTTVAVVFDKIESLEACLKDVKAADLGLSINIAAATDAANECSLKAGIRRHAVEYSLGFLGNQTKLPDAATLSLSTMCGHGMVSHAFVQKMIDWVKTRRRTPKECARYMARFCVCGIFNSTRAERLLSRSQGAAAKGG
jgi:hypothetical protein